MRLGLGLVALLLAVAPSVAAEEKKAVAPAAAVPAAAPAASDASATDRITVAELKKLVDAKNVLVVDVRSVDAYKTSHIPGSVSAPLAEIEKHIATLKSARKPIVTYCT